ncbi:MAG: cytochrome b [Rhodanobacteraceae bacterium]|jgi:cytochrome b561|nr:cytochrome b [Rhodanobacteraceae bacterium]MBK7042867.1 cytochrome b [Rhodanobacteraceae bacterium]MBP9154633.1 cytochrome b [Xanthomonadales bacterium]HQW80238.1 cytochrome b/b6 domain-containing protein [Pseudomonadota bacterium]
MTTAQSTWGRMARNLHWFMAALLILQWITGNWDDLLGVRFHVSLGLIVLLLALFRLFWRITHQAPTRVAAPTLPDRIAGAVHVLFYLVMIALPITGMIWRQAREKVIDLFGLFTLPQFIEPSKALAKQMHDVHEIGAYVFLALFALHVLGVLKRVLVDKDDTLKRMWG